MKFSCHGTFNKKKFAAPMSVSLEELCQMVNVLYDQARALIKSESSDGERGSNSGGCFSGACR